jgi:hypothetical protein
MNSRVRRSVLVLALGASALAGAAASSATSATAEETARAGLTACSLVQEARDSVSTRGRRFQPPSDLSDLRPEQARSESSRRSRPIGRSADEPSRLRRPRCGRGARPGRDARRVGPRGPGRPAPPRGHARPRPRSRGRAMNPAPRPAQQTSESVRVAGPIGAPRGQATAGPRVRVRVRAGDCRVSQRRPARLLDRGLPPPAGARHGDLRPVHRRHPLRPLDRGLDGARAP